MGLKLRSEDEDEIEDIAETTSDISSGDSGLRVASDIRDEAEDDGVVDPFSFEAVNKAAAFALKPIGNIGKGFVNFGKNTIGSAKEGIDKVGAGLNNLGIAGDNFTAAAVKKINQGMFNEGLITKDTFERVDRRYGGELATSSDLLRFGYDKLGISAFQIGGGAFEVVASPVSAGIQAATNIATDIEEDITGENKKAEAVASAFSFAELSIGEDVLDVLGISNYRDEEVRAVGGSVGDLVKAKAVFKATSAISKRITDTKKIEKAKESGNIEELSDALVETNTEVIEPEINLRTEVSDLVVNNDTSLNGFIDMAERLGLNLENTRRTLEQNNTANHAIKFDDAIHLESKKLTGEESKVSPLLEGKSLATKADRRAAADEIFKQTGVPKNKIFNIIDNQIKNKAEAKLTKIDDSLNKVISINDVKKAMARGQTEIFYDDYKSRPKSQGLVRLEDDGMVTRSVDDKNGGLYSFQLTAKGNQLVKKQGIDPKVFQKGLAHIDRDIYDDVYLKESPKIQQKGFNDKLATSIIKDINLGNREFVKLKNLVIDKELGEGGKTIDNDILATIDNLNNKFDLKLEKKIEKLVDVTTGEFDSKVLADILKDINAASKLEFLKFKNIKKQASTIKQKLEIEQKINNEVFKAGKREGIEEGLKKVAQMKDKYEAKMEEAKKKGDKKLKAQAHILRENWRLKKLQIEARIDKANAAKAYIIDTIKEMSRTKLLADGVGGKVISKLNNRTFFNAKTDGELKDRVNMAQKLLAEEQVRGLTRDIKKKLRIKNIKDKIDIEIVQKLDGAKKLMDSFRAGDASLEDLTEFSLRIDEVERIGRLKLKEKRAKLADNSLRVLDQIKEDGITDIKGTKPAAIAGEEGFVSKIIKSPWAAIRRGANELNFMYRILETIGDNSKAFKDTFLFEVDGQFNKVLSYKDTIVDKIVISMDKDFKKPKERIALGQYLLAFRRRVNEEGAVEAQGLEKLRADKTSWYHQKRDAKSLAKSSETPPKGLEWMTQSDWQDLRITRLGGVIEDGLKDKRFTDLQKTISDEFEKLRRESDEVLKLYDNEELKGVEGYIPLFTKDKNMSNEFGGFDDVIMNSQIAGSHTKRTTDSKNTYEYDAARLVSRGMMNQKYYVEMRPQYEKMKDILHGRKLNDAIYEVDGLDSNGTKANREGGLNNVFDGETERIMNIYMERIRNGGDKYGTAGNFTSRAVGYINNQYLGFNPGTILKQPLSFFDAAGIIGSRNVGWAMKAIFNGDLNRAALEASASLRNRFGGELSSKDLEQLSTGMTGKAFNKFQKVSMTGIRLADQFTATKVWMAAYRKHMISEGLMKEKDSIDGFVNDSAIEYADIMMQKAMGTVNPLFLPPAYRNPLTRVVGQLMTTQLNRLGILFNDIPDAAFKDKDYKRAAVGFTGYMTSSVADKAVTAGMGYLGFKLGIYTWEGYDKEFIEVLLGEDTEERLLTLGEWAVSDMFGGQQVKSLFTGDDLTVLGSFVSTIIKDVNKITDGVSDDDSEKIIQGFFDLGADSFGTWVGRRAADFYQNYYK